MARGYKGSEPCPNCGSGEWRVKKNGVCLSCEKTFALGEKYRKILALQTEKAGMESIAFKLIRNSAPHLFLPDELHFNRQSYAHCARSPAYLSGHGISANPNINSNILGAKINALLLAMDTGENPYKTVSYENAWHDAITVSLPIDQAKAFVELYDFLADYTRELQTQAKKEGQNLLINLAKKELEIADLA